MKASEWVGRASQDNATALASVVSPGIHRRPVLTRISASFSGAVTKLLQLYEAADNRSFVKGALQIDATPEKFKTTATSWYLIAGAAYEKTALTAQVFSAVHTIAASSWGIILIQQDSSGVITTKIPGATQTTQMAYLTSNAAVSAKPAPDSGKSELGYILINSKASVWTANTDDLTNASDVTTATFVDATEGTLRDEWQVINARDIIFGSGEGLRALAKDRCFIAVLAAEGTGGQTGKVSVEGYHVGA